MDNQGKYWIIGYPPNQIRISRRERESFWRRVHVGSSCWRWLGGHNRYHGTLTLKRDGKWREYRAHVVAYMLVKGRIPKGKIIDHECQVGLCCRPDHLVPATRKENTLRGMSPPAMNARKTECKRGHTEWGRKPNGARFCVECNRLGMIVYRKRRKRRNRENKRVSG